MNTYRRYHYESDRQTFSADAYKVASYNGVAWGVLGWEMEADEDTEWSGIYNRTGKVLAVMVGDDRVFTFDQDELEPLHGDDYCGGCGQIGCYADARDK